VIRNPSVIVRRSFAVTGASVVAVVVVDASRSTSASSVFSAAVIVRASPRVSIARARPRVAAMRRIYFFRARDRVAGAARAVVARSRASRCVVSASVFFYVFHAETTRSVSTDARPH
jgi:hypothetical protein